VVVCLRVDGDLQLEVADDGPCRAADWQAGVGLAAMRERVAELGGSLTAGPGPAGGRVLASFPMEPA
jgi:two-component system, NarL family, sensor kinase